MKHKLFVPRILSAALLAALQLCSLLSLYVIYEFTKLNASSIVQLPSGGYSLQADPQLWLAQILSTSWIWGSALLCILLAAAVLILLCIGRGKPSVPVIVTSAASTVSHVVLLLGFAFGCNDQLRSLEVVCHSMLRSFLQKLSLPVAGVWSSYLGLALITVLCVVFAAGVALSLALLLLELATIKKSKESDHA